jgi:hypothetical protein
MMSGNGYQGKDRDISRGGNGHSLRRTTLVRALLGIARLQTPAKRRHRQTPPQAPP